MATEKINPNRDGVYCCELTMTMKTTPHLTLSHWKAQGSVFGNGLIRRCVNGNTLHRDTLKHHAYRYLYNNLYIMNMHNYNY